MEAREDRVALIGGAPASDGVFRNMPTSRLMVYMAIIFATMFLSRAFSPLVVLPIGLVAAAMVYLLTAEGGTDTLGSRLTRRLRWFMRNTLGYRRYRPFDQEAFAAARGRQRREYRVRPDGAEGLRWLQAEPNKPGIAWHQPSGQEGYLSVAFEVEGSIRGLGGPEETEAGAEAWGRFLATLGGGEALATRIQTLTRVLPPEMAHHEQWLIDNLDENVPAYLMQSYAEVLRICDLHGMIQRHFIVVAWPLNDKFYDTARMHGKSLEGWRGLMEHEVAAKLRNLSSARLGHVRALTARQVAAFIVHTQDPRRPLDQVADIDPEQLGLRAYDTWGSTVSVANDGRKVYHATALIRSADVAVTQRGSFWVNPWLTGMSDGSARSISFHLNVVPAVDARRRVDREYEDARSAMLSAEEKGRALPRDARAAYESAQIRSLDLAAGMQNHGVEWIGYITVTAHSKNELELRKRIVLEQAQNDMAIARLDWLDSYHSAALGATWPLGRGIKARRRGDAKAREAFARVGKRKGRDNDEE